MLLPKSQFIRLTDVALVGPVMVVGAAALQRQRPVLAAVLGAFGVGTMLFNGYNYWKLAHS